MDDGLADHVFIPLSGTADPPGIYTRCSKHQPGGFCPLPPSRHPDEVVPKRGNKYGAIRCEVDGIKFDSRLERTRYWILKQRVACGEIEDLLVHPRYPLHANGEKIGTYVADFAYRHVLAGAVVEDCKSLPTKTAVYRLKKRLFEGEYGVKITEVTA